MLVEIKTGTAPRDFRVSKEFLNLKSVSTTKIKHKYKYASQHQALLDLINMKHHYNCYKFDRELKELGTKYSSLMDIHPERFLKLSEYQYIVEPYLIRFNDLFTGADIDIDKISFCASNHKDSYDPDVFRFSFCLNDANYFKPHLYVWPYLAINTLRIPKSERHSGVGTNLISILLDSGPYLWNVFVDGDKKRSQEAKSFWLKMATLYPNKLHIVNTDNRYHLPMKGMRLS